MLRKFTAELIGTAWLVLGGCGSAVLAAGFPTLGIGFVGVAFAFGLTVLTMAYAIGHVSGCHLNPAVSVGLWAGGRFKASELPAYIAAQLIGGIVGAAVLYAIASGKAGFDVHAGFASNGYGAVLGRADHRRRAGRHRLPLGGRSQPRRDRGLRRPLTARSGPFTPV